MTIDRSERVYCGNDVVDLELWFQRSPRDQRRFAQRIAHDREVIRGRSQGEPVSTALFWAAKESAFKILSKFDARVRFFPSEFCVVFDRSGRRRAVVEHAAGTVYLQCEVSSDYVHCWGTNRKNLDVLWHRVMGAQTPTEEASSASTRIRQWTYRVLESFGWPDVTIDRPRLPSGRRGPPVLLQRGIEIPLDVSLSHDGPWLSLCLLDRPSKTKKEKFDVRSF